MVLIGRILIILVAFFAASAAAGIVLVFSIVFPQWGGARFGYDDGSFHVVATVAFVMIGSFGFLPALIIALVTEALNIRNALIYATGGAVLGALTYLGIARFDPETMTMVGGVRREIEIMVGAGIVAGLVYWLIAGRNAGAWREQVKQLKLR
jgi:hypothetical protein